MAATTPRTQQTTRSSAGTRIGSELLNKQDLQKLLTVQMPYGKYQGRLLADLPGAYLAWFARNGFPPGQLGELLALALEIDHNGLSALLEPLRSHAQPH